MMMTSGSEMAIVFGLLMTSACNGQQKLTPSATDSALLVPRHASGVAAGLLGADGASPSAAGSPQSGIDTAKASSAVDPMSVAGAVLTDLGSLHSGTPQAEGAAAGMPATLTGSARPSEPSQAGPGGGVGGVGGSGGGGGAALSSSGGSGGGGSAKPSGPDALSVAYDVVHYLGSFGAASVRADGSSAAVDGGPVRSAAPLNSPQPSHPSLAPSSPAVGPAKPSA